MGVIMKNGMSTYFERIQNPGMEIIDFSYLYSHPECIYIVFETVLYNFMNRYRIFTRCDILTL